MSQAITQAHAAGQSRDAGWLLNGLAYRLAGLAFATVLPAAFWVVVSAGLANASGVTIGASSFVAMGAIIAIFLGSVCAPIILKSE